MDDILEKLSRNKPNFTSDREAKLQQAEAVTVQLKSWLEKAEALRKEALAIFPVPFGATKAQARKRRTLTELETLAGNKVRWYNAEDLKRKFAEEDRLFAKWEIDIKNAKLAVEQGAEKAKKAQAKIEDAILYLQEQGLKFAVDFGIDNALYKANQLSFDLACKAAEEVGDAVSFDGDDYCDGDCYGWTPGEYRCGCSNRRVDWEIDFDEYYDFRNPYLRAVAW